MCVGGEGYRKKSTWDTAKQQKYTEKKKLSGLSQEAKEWLKAPFESFKANSCHRCHKLNPQTRLGQRGLSTPPAGFTTCLSHLPATAVS